MAPVAARADSTAVTAPHVVSTTSATSVTLGGSTFVNQGLVGTIRQPADLHDFNGETLGSFSGMAIDLSTWRRGANGAYTGSLYTLPDRGPNNIGGFTTTNYAGRLNKFTINLTPYDGAAPLASNVQQGTLTQSGGFLFRDTTGQLFTGRDPLTNVIVRDGISYPSPPAGDVARAQAKGVLVVGTATTVAEAAAVAEAGCDAVVAQGAEAGGHRGGFDPGSRTRCNRCRHRQYQNRCRPR